MNRIIKAALQITIFALSIQACGHATGDAVNREGSNLHAIVIEPVACPRKCEAFLITLHPGGEWSYDNRAAGETFNGRSSVARSSFTEIERIVRVGGPNFTTNVGERPPIDTEATVTALTTHGALVSFIPNHGSNDLRFAVRQIVRNVQMLVDARISARQKRLSDYSALVSLTLTESAYSRACPGIVATFRGGISSAVITSIEARRNTIQFNEPLTNVAQILRQNGVAKLHPRYPVRWHDVRGVNLDLSYQNSEPFSIAAPDRTQWPANLSKTVLSLNRILRAHNAIERACHAI